MTIKSRLFISNIRMVLVSFGAFALAARIVMFLVYGTGRPGRVLIVNILEAHNQYVFTARWILVLAIFVLFVSIMNSIITHRMVRRIVKPLEPLGEGVSQIHANNLAYRIDYREDDEFRPICDAFDEMAAKLEASIREKEKDEWNRRELIAGISHDLSTPLTSIKGCVEGIEDGIAATPEMRDNYLRIIKDKAAVMEHIIDQLFFFSKLDMDEFPLAIKSVDISISIADMIEDSISEYASRGLDIKLNEKLDNFYITADVIMLRNVIANILENSVKYKLKERGKMEINISFEDGFALLSLTDDGPGVHEDMLPKLFDVFYRTDPSRNKKGSGLGLAISAKIIEGMGGNIYAELPATGGLAIIIKFPLQQREKI